MGVKHIENTKYKNFSIQGRFLVKNGISKTVAIKIMNGAITLVYEIKYKQ